MRAPVSWLAELVDVPSGARGADIAADLVKVGLEEEGLYGGEITGPLVVGRVLDKTDEPQKNGKTIHFCHVDVGPHGQMLTDGVPQEIVCGAHNFDAGDLVVVVLPGATLAGGFAISSRKTYGHPSNGMICSAPELGIPGDGSGIIVLTDWFKDEPDVLASLEPGQDAMPLLGLGEEVVEVNVTPDRGYCFSMRGIAREYALATKSDSLRDPVRIAVPPPNDTGYEVRIEDSAPVRGVLGCDRYVARAVRDVDVTAASPRWMATRLTQMGMRPISLAVDVTNYLMLLTGQPLHAFDLDTLSGAIEVRRARPGETLTTLDDVERHLDPEDLLITDGGAVPLAIAGVMGGETSEVTPTTTNVLIEAAHFDPITVARSSRRHHLGTEASKRFERGVDPEMTAAVAQLAVALLVQYGGGTADPGVTDVDRRTPIEPFPFRTKLAWELIQPPESSGGIAPPDLTQAAVIAALRSLGCTVDVLVATPAEVPMDVPAGAPTGGASSDAADWVTVQVTPPPWRPDLRNGPDLVEEVARLRGYSLIPSVLPVAPGGRGLTPARRATRLVAATLAGLGATEVVSYPFIAPELFDQLGYDAADPRRHAVRLANPLSAEQPLLRTGVLDTLLGVLRLNVNRGAKDVRVYEIGLVTQPGDDPGRAPVPPVGIRPDDATLDAIVDAVPPQPRHLGIAATGEAVPAGPSGGGRPVTAEDLVGVALSVGRALGLSLTPVAATQAPWHPGRCAALTLPDGTIAGYAGELHPKVLTALDCPPRTCAAELDLGVLLAAAGDPVQAEPLSTYPVAHTDVALVVDEQVPAGDVETALRAGAGAELEAVTLFDVYRGDQVGAGRKSLAYRLSFRAADRTLTTTEVNAARDAATAEAATRIGAVQRA